MYGLQAISANNGWSMAFLGATIDFLCLVFLSIVISQLHKLLDFWENRKKSIPAATEKSSSVKPKAAKKIQLPARFPEDIKEAARLYEPLVKQLGQPINLVDLHKAARENDYPHPHLTISAFRQAGILTSLEEGVFNWNIN